MLLDRKGGSAVDVCLLSNKPWLPFDTPEARSFLSVCRVARFKNWDRRDYRDMFLQVVSVALKVHLVSTYGMITQQSNASHSTFLRSFVFRHLKRQKNIRLGSSLTACCMST